jgi:hypothetical protein
MRKSLHPFLVLDFTTPRSCTLENYIFSGSNPRAFTGVWKHCHPIPGAFAHCLHSLGLVLPSVFHD